MIRPLLALALTLPVADCLATVASMVIAAFLFTCNISVKDSRDRANAEKERIYRLALYALRDYWEAR